MTSRRFWIWRHLGYYGSGRVTGSKAVGSGHLSKILTRFHLCLRIFRVLYSLYVLCHCRRRLCHQGDVRRPDKTGCYWMHFRQRLEVRVDKSSRPSRWSPRSGWHEVCKRRYTLRNPSPRARDDMTETLHSESNQIESNVLNYSWQMLTQNGKMKREMSNTHNKEQWRI